MVITHKIYRIQMNNRFYFGTSNPSKRNGGVYRGVESDALLAKLAKPARKRGPQTRILIRTWVINGFEGMEEGPGLVILVRWVRSFVSMKRLGRPGS